MKHINYLNNYVRRKFSWAGLFDITAEFMVSESDFELHTVVHVGDAGVGSRFGVYLAVEQFVGLHFGDHVVGSTVYGDVVTGSHLMRYSAFRLKVRFFDVLQTLAGVVRQSTHLGTGITVVEAVAPELFVCQTELPALLLRLHFFDYGVDSL